MSVDDPGTITGLVADGLAGVVSSLGRWRSKQATGAAVLATGAQTDSSRHRLELMGDARHAKQYDLPEAALADRKLKPSFDSVQSGLILSALQIGAIRTA